MGFSNPVVVQTTATWADEDGDGLPDVMDSFDGTTYSSSVGPKSDLMLTASDGWNSVSLTYAPLSDPSVYTRGQNQAGVTQDMGGPLYVVKQLQSTDGVGGRYNLTYAYAGAHRNVQGRGFLGFASRTVADSRNGSFTTETYNNFANADGSQWEFAGTLAERKVQQWLGGPVLSDTVNYWSSIAPDGVSNRRYPYIHLQTVKSYELNSSGTPVTTKTTTTTIDNYGTPYDVTVVTAESSSGISPGTSRTQETYSPVLVNDSANWCLSKPTSTQIKSSHTLDDGALITQAVDQTWDHAHCRITDRKLDVGTDYEADTHYDYDSWNNVSDQVVKATNLPQGAAGRTTSFDYQTNAIIPGLFVMRATNAAGVTQFGWDPALGVRISATDPNGFTTSWEYDQFGRMAHELRPDGTGSRNTYSPCKDTTNYCGDSLLRYMVQVDERDVNDHIISYRYVFYDSLGRAKYDETLGFSGALSVVETLYDQLGNVASRSNPSYAGTGRYQGTSYSYDFFNRVVQTQQPTSDTDSTLATTTTTYNGLTVTVTDANIHSRTQVSNGWGDVIQVTAAGSNTTKYTYDAFSHLKTTTDAPGNVTTFGYTARGFKLTSSDPDMGSWSYTYDGLGEMLSQTDAKSQVTHFHYDALGRMDTRTDPGASSPDTVWHWDTAANGIGQIGSVSGTNGYFEQYAYGPANSVAAGKLVGTQTTVAGNTYAVDYQFDSALGKLKTTTYPMAGSGRFAVLYDYQNGYLKDIKDYTNQIVGPIYWQAMAQDARGHVIQEQYGNGQQSYLYFDETNGRLNSIETGPGGGAATQNLAYSWDRVGNLLSRQDGNQHLSETFAYDRLDRLTSTAVNGGTPLSISYDAIGNISSKSDLGAYNYTVQLGGCNYTGLTAQPHAVRNAGGTTYCYDADGNMTSRGGGTIIWYPYNQPKTISQPGGNNSTFFYDPDRNRYRQSGVNGTTTEDRIYIAGLFEKLTSSAVGVEYRHYIMADGKKVAVRVFGASRNDTYYFHDDHLGSTSAITDQSGALQLQESFDAWGKRRGSGWTGSPSPADVAKINSTTHSGFTGQEELDNLSLVDLNGRVYDPTVARFMSADPYVQAPYESQSLNHYSYTFDNPLNATDPTGFEACTGTHIDQPGKVCSVTYTIPVSGDADGAQKQQLGPTTATVVSGDATHIGTGQDDGLSTTREQTLADQRGDVSTVTVTAANDHATRAHDKGLLHVLKTVLDVAGLVPGIGTVTNLASAIISGIEGNWKEAGISVLAAVPLIGEAAEGIKAARLAEEGLQAARGAAATELLVIGRGADLAKSGAVQAGERTLKWDTKLPDFKAEWAENSGRLRAAMRTGQPIRDASPGNTGGLFLNAERNLLRDRGWTFHPQTNYWNPPVPR